MLKSVGERTSRGEGLRAGLYGVVLLWINAYIARDLFFGSSSHMGSMHGFWTAIASRAGSSWFHATWWPFWEMGIPFEYTYPPLVPGLAAAIAAVRGVPAAVGFQSVTGLCYILGPLTLFVAAWRLSRAPGASFFAAALYSLTSLTQILLPDGEYALQNFRTPRRLFVMAVWDDTPHLAALAFLPLIVLFLALALETRRPVYYAGAAACIAGAALSSAFGPVVVVVAALCLVLVLPRAGRLQNLRLSAAIGLWGWAIAAPFLSPSLLLAIREANAASSEEGWTFGSVTAFAFTVFGCVVLWQFLPRWTAGWGMRFLALFAWIMISIPLARLWMHDHFLPQPNRYKFEIELALCVLIVFAARPWWQRLPAPVRGAAVFLLLALAGEQVRDFRKSEKQFTAPVDITSTVEYKAAMWAEQSYPKIRFFMPGSMAQWTNTFTAIQQFTGESFTMAVNQAQQNAHAAIAFGTGDPGKEAALTLAWLKAYGVGVIAVGGKDSREYWKTFTNPGKFEGVLPALWKEDGVTMYRVPLREFTLAHVVPESAIVRRAPTEPDDIAEVEKYVAGLDDPSLSGTAFDWEGRNRIRIRTTVGPGQVVSVQVTYHPGWHAAVASRPQRLFQDGLGLIWLRPDCRGACEIVLDYDGGWELRLCRWLSWLGLAGLALVPLWLRRHPGNSTSSRP